LFFTGETDNSKMRIAFPIAKWPGGAKDTKQQNLRKLNDVAWHALCRTITEAWLHPADRRIAIIPCTPDSLDTLSHQWNEGTVISTKGGYDHDPPETRRLS
jgi:hypothetical protein